MIIYQANKREFLHHAFRDDIEDVVERQFRSATGYGVGQSEFQSWKHSLLAMGKVLLDEEIPDDVGVAIDTSCRKPPSGSTSSLPAKMPTLGPKSSSLS